MKVNFYRIIRILQVEGSDRHAELVRLHLYASGLNCAVRRVTSREQYVAALDESWADVVIVGSGLPMLSVAEALDIAHRNWRHLPVVFAEAHEVGQLGELDRTILNALMLAREIRGRRIADMAARHAPLLAARIRSERTAELAPLLLTGTSGFAAP
jgi:CheY-like chemotaxis protein